MAKDEEVEWRRMRRLNGPNDYFSRQIIDISFIKDFRQQFFNVVSRISL